MTGANIAFDGQYFGKEAPRPEHRIAALARVGGDADGAILARIEGRDQPVDQHRRHVGHVAEQDQGAVAIGRQRAQTALERCAQTL